jgi:hypothetical protein
MQFILGTMRPSPDLSTPAHAGLNAKIEQVLAERKRQASVILIAFHRLHSLERGTLRQAARRAVARRHT